MKPFTDRHDLRTLHPRTAELVENAAQTLRKAQRSSGHEVVVWLAAAESYTLRANSALAEFLYADPRKVLPLIRQAVDAATHQHPDRA